MSQSRSISPLSIQPFSRIWKNDPTSPGWVTMAELDPVSQNNTSLIEPNQDVAGIFGLTRIERWFQLILFYSLIGGAWPLCINVAIAIGIIRDKRLRTRFFIIIWFLVITRAIYSIQYIIIAGYRLLWNLHLASLHINLTYCYLLHFNFYYVSTMEMVLLLLLLIDQSIAIIAYKYYRRLTRVHAVQACILILIITFLLKIIPSVISVDFTKSIFCANAFVSVTPQFTAYIRSIDFILAFLILIFYIILILYVYFRHLPAMRAMSRNNADRSGLIVFKRQSKLLAILRNLLLLHCGTKVLEKAFFASVMYVPHWAAYRMVAYVGMLIAVEIFCNALILLFSNEELKKAAFPCFRVNEPRSTNISSAQNMMTQIRN